MTLISIVQLGTLDYAKGLDLQQKLVALRKEEKIGDVLLLLEHKPVITLGRNAKATNVIASPEFLEQRRQGETVRRRAVVVVLSWGMNAMQVIDDDQTRLCLGDGRWFRAQDLGKLLHANVTDQLLARHGPRSRRGRGAQQARFPRRRMFSQFHLSIRIRFL